MSHPPIGCVISAPVSILRFHCVKSTQQSYPQVLHITSDSHALNIRGLHTACQFQKDILLTNDNR